MSDNISYADFCIKEAENIQKYQNRVRRDFLNSKGVITAQNNPENTENQNNIQEACALFGYFITGGLKQVQEYINSKTALEGAKTAFWADLTKVRDTFLIEHKKMLTAFKDITIEAIINSQLFCDVLNDPSKNARTGKPMLE